MPLIPDFTVLATAIQHVFRGLSAPLSGDETTAQDPLKKHDLAVDTTSPAESPCNAPIILPRQITVSVGSSATTLLCNPAHSYPACSSCLGGTAWGTTPGCTAPGTTPTVTPTTPTQPSTPGTTTPASTPTPGATLTATASGSSHAASTSSQSLSFAFTSVIVPSISNTVAITETVGGSVLSQIGFPTTPYTGQALLVGTCITPMYTALVLSNGGILEAPIIGCADDRPDCCPSLKITSNPATSTTTATLPGYESTAVASALSAYPISVCPSDYTDLGSVCCPAGFSLYSQAIIGQTPCYTLLSTSLPANAASAAIAYISAQVDATASAGSAPSVTIQVVVDEVFALSLPHTPSHSGLSTGAKIGIGVGAGVGALLLLILLVWVFVLRRKLSKERNVTRQSVDMARKEAGGGLIPVADIPNRYSGPVSQNLSGIPSSAATGVEGGLIPAAAVNRYSGIVKAPQASAISYSQPPPSTGPSPAEMQAAPWAPYGPSGEQVPYQTYQQPQSTQPWQQAPASAPYEAAGQPIAPQHVGYSELAGTQNAVYEAAANHPPPVVSGMPTGAIYTQPVEIQSVERGPSDTPQLVHSVQSVQQ